MPTDAEVADEISSLIEERNLDREHLLGNSKYPLRYFELGEPLPFDNVRLMVSLALALRCESWYLYKFAGKKLPPELLAIVRKQSANADRAAAKRAKKKLAAEERAAADAIRATLTTRICPSCRFELDRSRFYSSGAYCRACTSENNRKHRAREKLARAAEAASIT